MKRMEALRSSAQRALGMPKCRRSVAMHLSQSPWNMYSRPR